ncbi:MAG: hypothetical protein A2Z66_00340 [Chloroflexi bacterium RBG_13_66_10]|nr:MAG: hypothetical protein A2Z66_00340 [Chloroflexi bacterium RBG_13_66_10]
MSRAIRLLGLAVVLAGLAAGAPASAQVGFSVRLSAPSVEAFPQVSLYLTVSDSTGRRVPGLPASAFRLVEDLAAVTEPVVTEAVVGTRQVFVINASASMRVRDLSGRTRFDYLQEALLDWWQLPEAAAYGADDLTLVTPDGVLVAHSPVSAELAASLDGFQTTFEGDVTDYDLLLQGLDFLSDPPSRPGMLSFLIFLTPSIPAGREAALTNALSRAAESGTVIYPIFTGTAEAAEGPEAQGLRQLASTTGGSFLVFDPAQGLVGLGQQILEHRTQYQLTYSSLANRAGEHVIQVAVRMQEAEVVSAPLTFNVDIRPPIVAFINAPSQITRELDDPSLPLEALLPTGQSLRLLVTFPDGHPRPIASSRLIVDDLVVLQRAAAPFDEFDWDLTSFVESGTHIVRASVEDNLGLEAQSEDIAVEVEVIGPPRGLAALRPALGPLAAAVGILVAGILAAVGLRSVGRMRAAPNAPATVPPPPRRSIRRSGVRLRTEEEPAEAYLVSEEGGAAFALTGVDVVLGRDASLAAVVLEDPSVAGLHARLIRQADGDYVLRDQGSVAGTWVNYEPVPSPGRRLRHGDLVHIGRVGLRFRLAGPLPQRSITIRPVTTVEDILPPGADRRP